MTDTPVTELPADDAVTVTEKDGMVIITVKMESQICIERSVLEEGSAAQGGLGAMICERIECDMQMDRDGTNPYFVPAIDKKLAEHLASTPVK